MSVGLFEQLVNNVMPATAVTISVLSAITLLLRLGVTRIKFGSFTVEAGSKQKPTTESVQAELKAAKETQNLTPGEKQFLLLERYHGQVILQSTISFWFSLIFGVVGFLVIISSVYGSNDTNAVLLKVIGGTIVDAVSALLFVQSNKARDSMKDFFDKLRADRKLEESLRLAESLSDKDMQNRLKTAVVLEFAGVSNSEKTLPDVYGKNSGVKEP